MSLASLLLAFAPAIAARFNPVPELEAENKRLKGELEGVKGDLERLHVVCERAGLWRNEALRQRHNEPLPMGGQHALPHPPQWAYAQAQNALAGQASEQQQMAMAQNAQNAPQAYSQALAGLQHAEGLLDAWSRVCDCSPSRSAALGLLVPGA